MRNRSRSIQWMLARRIGLVGLAAGALFASLAFFAERDRIGDVVSDRALVAGKRFNSQAQATLDADSVVDGVAMQRELDLFLEPNAVEHRSGSFVLAAVYNHVGTKLAGYVDPNYPAIDEIKRRMDAADHRLESGDFGDLAFVRVEGRPHIHVAVPLESTDGAVVAQLEGVFAVSPHGVADMRAQVAHSVIAVFLIVLLTTALIYPIIHSLVGRLGRMTVSLLDANLETLKVLGGAVAKRDSDTDSHNYRVTIYSVRLAEARGLPNSTIRSLIKGAFVHDVGKIAIRDAVLLKPGKLDDAEYAVMKTHVEHGLDLTASSNWLRDGASVVGCHHEKFAGGGYPRGLRGVAIPVIARIFAIADVFDAVASRRPYKAPHTFEETMEVLEQGRGSHFDPDLLDTFSEIARGLYDEFAGIDGDKPREVLDELTRRYFHQAVGDMVSESPEPEEPEEPTSEQPKSMDVVAPAGAIGT